MFYSSIKIALRNLYREKLYAAINIAGLTLAITCVLILGLYLRSELTYDQHFDNHENIYRVVREMNWNGAVTESARVSFAVGPLMAADFNEVETFVSFRPLTEPTFIRQGEESNYWSRAFYASPNIFDVFSHDIIYGNSDFTLDDPQYVAVSESFSRHYFGDANPIGELLENEIGEPFVIGLVFADLPENTHLKYDLLLSYSALPEYRDIHELLHWTQDYTYLVMREGFNPRNFAQLSESMYQRYLEPVAIPGEYSLYQRYWLEPLAEVHYYSDMPSDEPQGSRAYLYSFITVANFILIVACINYTNLATARSIRRSREVGIRKIIGANRNVLVWRFLAEAVLCTLISTLIAIVLVEILSDTAWVTQLLGKEIEFSLFTSPHLILWLSLFSLGIGLVAGLYPAIYLSSWAPLSALVSSGKNTGKGNAYVRQALVLTQFIISIAVIASTLLIASQMRFISDRELGFDKENLFTIRMNDADLIRRSPILKEQLLQHADILGITLSDNIPGQELGSGYSSVYPEIPNGNTTMVLWRGIFVDNDYLDVMGAELVSGVDFSESPTTQSGSVNIVNEAYVRSQGWDDPLNRVLGRNGDTRIIGVVNNFNYRSLHSPVEPLVLIPTPDYSSLRDSHPALQKSYMTLRLSGRNTRATLNDIRETFEDFDPVHPVEFAFLDDRLSQLYQSEQSLMRLVGIFAGICIFISALGLYGLAAYTTEQRAKEIAIRKVLGASTGSILMMLSRSTMGLVAIGSVVASAVTYWVMQNWLANFAYRADINIWIFVIATITALLVAFTTIALQSSRSAQSSPIEALRIG